jgi:transposase
MNRNATRVRYFIRRRGKHKSQYYRLVYTFGNYATKELWKDMRCVERTVVLIKTVDGIIDIDQYAKENGYVPALPHYIGIPE